MKIVSELSPSGVLLTSHTTIQAKIMGPKRGMFLSLVIRKYMITHSIMVVNKEKSILVDFQFIFPKST